MRRPPGFQSATHTQQRRVPSSSQPLPEMFPFSCEGTGVGGGAALRVALVLLGLELGLQSSWGQEVVLEERSNPRPKEQGRRSEGGGGCGSARGGEGRAGRMWPGPHRGPGASGRAVATEASTPASPPRHPQRPAQGLAPAGPWDRGPLPGFGGAGALLGPAPVGEAWRQGGLAEAEKPAGLAGDAGAGPASSWPPV